MSHSVESLTFHIEAADRRLAALLKVLVPRTIPLGVSGEICVTVERAGRSKAGRGMRLSVPSGEVWIPDPCSVRLFPSQRRSARILFMQALPRAIAEIARMRGVVVLRSAAVMAGGKCLLIPGNTQLGKSSLALALAARGFQLLADSIVLLRRDGNQVLACTPDRTLAPRPRTVRLLGSSRLCFRWLDLRPVYRRYAVLPRQLELQEKTLAPVRAVLIPFRGSPVDPPRLIPLGPRDAFAHLLACRYPVTPRPESRLCDLDICGDISERVQTSLVYYHLSAESAGRVADLVRRL